MEIASFYWELLPKDSFMREVGGGQNYQKLSFGGV